MTLLKYILIWYIGCITFVVFGQTNNDRTDVMMDFTLLVVPTKLSNLEYYQIGFDKKIKKRTYFGGSFTVFVGESKLTPYYLRTGVMVTTGFKWPLLPKQKWFIDPSLHLIYNTWVERVSNAKLNATGLQGGVNLGYCFKQFGIGVALKTTYIIGYRHAEEDNDAYFGHGWYILDYGLNLSYTFNFKQEL